MLEEVSYLLEQQILEPPYAINFVLQTPTQGGQRGTPKNLLDMIERLPDLQVPLDSLRITISSMGRTQLPMTTIGIAMGINIRVGMEDNVIYRKAEPATPAEVRPLLGLRGRDRGKIPR
jgi:3-keto-5-aminohexanoate cleavage enzyme